MRILYGLSGDGYGHSSRAKVVGKYLSQWGHEVKMLTYGRAVSVLQEAYDIFEVSGMEIQYAAGELKKRATIANSLKMFKDNAIQWKRFHHMFKDFSPDVCISDMEPIVPILRFWYDKPLVCIDNQHRMTHLDLAVPRKYRKDFYIARTVVENFVARADHFIITSFIEAPIIKKNTTIVPPVIRSEVKALEPVYGEKILVYLTRENQEVLDILKGFEHEFVVFGYDTDKWEDNLQFKRKAAFLDELRCCKAIIATAGFTLISEALYLKKPYLALPLKGQFEQVLNSLFLKSAGYGNYCDALTEQEVAAFLDRLDDYRKKLSGYHLDCNKLPETLQRVLSKV